MGSGRAAAAAAPDSPYRYPGRKRADDRAALAGIVFVLKTGIAGNQLPRAVSGCSGVTPSSTADRVIHDDNQSVHTQTLCPAGGGGGSGRRMVVDTEPDDPGVQDQRAGAQLPGPHQRRPEGGQRTQCLRE